jgi:hypothetical protein
MVRFWATSVEARQARRRQVRTRFTGEYLKLEDTGKPLKSQGTAGLLRPFQVDTAHGRAVLSTRFVTLMQSFTLARPASASSWWWYACAAEGAVASV